MRFKYFLIFLLIFPLTGNALDITTNKFDKLQIKNPDFDIGAFTFPAVLIYDSNGKLKTEIFGKNITALKTYSDTLDNKKTLTLTSPNSSIILSSLGINKKTKLPELIFFSMEICPPCRTMAAKFKSEISGKISKKYEVFFINVLDR